MYKKRRVSAPGMQMKMNAHSRASGSVAAANQHPAIESEFQSQMVKKFGTEILSEGFTAIPVLVQRHYRDVPGDALIDKKTGKILQKNSVMTPTEFSLMTEIWAYWWSAGNKPWPSISQLALHLRKSDRTIQRYLDSLERKGFLMVLRQYNAEGKQISNRYDFSPFLQKLRMYLDTQKLSQELYSEGKECVTEKKTHDTPVRGCFSPSTRDARERGEMKQDKKIVPSRMPSTRKREDKDGSDLMDFTGVSWEHLSRHQAIDLVIRQCSFLCNDQPSLVEEWRMQVNVTRASNIVVREEEGSEIHWTTKDIVAIILQALEEAMDKPEQKIIKRNPDGSANKIPYFFQRFVSHLDTASDSKRGEAWVASLGTKRLLPEQATSPEYGTLMSVSNLPQIDVLEGTAKEFSTSLINDEYRVLLALEVCNQLVLLGLVHADRLEMHQDQTHRCGCPLYRNVFAEKWLCVYCYPDQRWPHRIQALISSMVEV